MEGGNGKVEQRTDSGEGEKDKKKIWETRGGERTGKQRRDEDVRKREGRREQEARGGEDKNDPIDRLYPGSRIDVHLSEEISPTNHDVTSTGQYHTLQASSSHTHRPPSVYTHSTPGPPLLLELINLPANHKHAHHT